MVGTITSNVRATNEWGSGICVFNDNLYMYSWIPGI